jgi:hypothetical protein
MSDVPLTPGSQPQCESSQGDLSNINHDFLISNRLGPRKIALINRFTARMTTPGLRCQRGQSGQSEHSVLRR